MGFRFLGIRPVLSTTLMTHLGAQHRAAAGRPWLPVSPQLRALPSNIEAPGFLALSSAWLTNTGIAAWHLGMGGVPPSQNCPREQTAAVSCHQAHRRWEVTGLISKIPDPDPCLRSRSVRLHRILPYTWSVYSLWPVGHNTPSMPHRGTHLAQGGIFTSYIATGLFQPC